MNIILPSLSLLFIGSIAGNLLFTGHLVYGIPLTIAGFVLALFILRMEKKELELNRRLEDKPLY